MQGRRRTVRYILHHSSPLSEFRFASRCPSSNRLKRRQQHRRAQLKENEELHLQSAHSEVNDLHHLSKPQVECLDVPLRLAPRCLQATKNKRKNFQSRWGLTEVGLDYEHRTRFVAADCHDDALMAAETPNIPTISTLDIDGKKSSKIEKHGKMR